jgi:Kdo2-lipid IVA lauroyltransferase/acyltransferase
MKRLKWLLFKLAFLYAKIYAFSSYYRKEGRRREIEGKFDFFFPGRWSPEERKRAVRHIFELRGSRKVMHYLIPLMDPGLTREFTKVEGLDHLNHALEEGRGVVLMSGHFGNPYLGFNALRAMGYDLVLVKGGRPREAGKEGHRRVRHTDTMEKTIFIYDPSLADQYKDRILETLRAGKIINYYGDTREGRKKETISLLGAKLGFPTGMIHLAHRANARIVPLLFLYQGGMTTLIFREPIDRDWKEGEEGYGRVVIEFAKLLESDLLRFPEQYMGIYGPTVLSQYYETQQVEERASSQER